MSHIDHLNQQLTDIGARNLASRISLPFADHELRAVERHINQLLGRLQKSFEQLNEYSATVAHELRTPLTLIRLKVDEAANQLDPETAESIQEELARLTEYVDQSLLLARAEQGRLTVDLSTMAILPFLDELLEDYSRWAAQEGRSLVTEIDESGLIRSDRRYLKQILHNLLTNAVKFGVCPFHFRFRRRELDFVCCIQNQVNPAINPSGGTGRGLRIAEVLSRVLNIRLETRLADGHFHAELVGRWDSHGQEEVMDR